MRPVAACFVYTMLKTTTILIGLVGILVTIGIVMLASTSGIQGQASFDDPTHFIKRQAVFLVVGLMGAYVMGRIPYVYWRVLAIPLALVSLALLCMTLMPGVGIVRNGARRWLALGPITFQPSEVAKLASVVLLAWWMARYRRYAHEFGRGLLAPLTLLGLFSVLIFVEPDFGTTALVATVGMAIMFMGGTRVGYLLVSGLLGASAFALMIAENEERRNRVIAFLDPEKYERGEAFQLMQALYAFVVGGPGGVGLGQSMQKLHYLPEAHTDFIFAILGEEFGFGATLGVVLLFFAFFICGLVISRSAADSFGKLLAFGITTLITLQAALNIGVVTGSLPTKGLPLPFMSFGGTSLVITLAMVGILVNVGRYGGPSGSRGEEFIKDKGQHL